MIFFFTSAQELKKVQKRWASFWSCRKLIFFKKKTFDYVLTLNWFVKDCCIRTDTVHVCINIKYVYCVFFSCQMIMLNLLIFNQYSLFVFEVMNTNNYRFVKSSTFKCITKMIKSKKYLALNIDINVTEAPSIPNWVSLHSFIMQQIYFQIHNQH